MEWIELYPSKRYAEILSPSTLEMWTDLEIGLLQI